MSKELKIDFALKAKSGNSSIMNLAEAFPPGNPLHILTNGCQIRADGKGGILYSAELWADPAIVEKVINAAAERTGNTVTKFNMKVF